MKSARRATSAIGALAFITFTLTSGCSGAERICGDDEYPTKFIGSSSGQACFKNGSTPAPGYVRYPAESEPEILGDQNDADWQFRILDAYGQSLPGSQEFDYSPGTGEPICDNGQFPVRERDSGTNTCLKDGTDASSSQEVYPGHQVPRFVGDTWDKKWSGAPITDTPGINATD